jgi:pSer/pThr/pTyr-binding forkhead associated (FHA) protein
VRVAGRPPTGKAAGGRERFTLNAPFHRTAPWLRSGPLELTKPTYTIGRSPDADLFIEDPTVSTSHARLEAHPEGYELTDLGSTNGTTVNGRRISAPTVLKGGEQIGIGNVVLRIDRSD